MSNNVTFDEMNELLDEINRSGGETWVEIDGQTYYTDWGYGVVAIEFFIRMLKNRKSDSDATLVRHNVAEDARSLIDDEVHRDCEYYVYSQLRDCIDVIDDDYERLKAESDRLRELVRDYEHCSMHADCSRCEYDGKLSTHCPLSPCFPDIDELLELGVEVDG